jgi:hypothetical protein
MRALVTALLLTSCATASQAGLPYYFPEEFRATQVVEVRGDSGDVTLLASVHQAPGSFTVTFFEPALQAPLLSARIVHGAFIEERFAEFPLPPGEVERLARQVVEIYGAQHLRIGAEGASTHVEPWNVSISDPRGSESCRMPEWIHLRIGKRKVPAVDVRTIDVQCDHPK